MSATEILNKSGTEKFGDGVGEQGKKVRVFVVDDHRLMHMGIKSMLLDEPDMEMCGGAESVEEALELIPQVRPDVAVLDISLSGDIDGVMLAGMLSKQYPDILLLMLSMHEESAYAQRAFDAGALGYLNKADAAELLVVAIRTILGGGLFFSPTSFSQEVLLKIGTLGKRVLRPSAADVIKNRRTDF